MKSNLNGASRSVSNRSRLMSGKSSDFEEIIDCVLSECLGEVQAESGSLFLRLKKDTRFKLVKTLGARPNHHCGKTIAVGEGVSGYVAEKKEPILIADIEQDPSLISRKEKPARESFMSCPVLNGSTVLAVINVSGRKNGRPFGTRDLKKFEALASSLRPQIKKAVDMYGAAHAAAFEFEEPVAPENIDEALDLLQRYSSIILRSLSRYVVVFDRRFRIVYCSNKSDFNRLIAGAKDRKLKQNILDLPIDVEKEDLKEKLEGLLLKGNPFSLNNIRIKEAYDVRFVNMFFSPFLSTQGKLLGGMLLIDDNTKIHEMQQRLFEAEKFSFIGSLLSMISHEVNVPLDGVNRLINLSVGKVGDDDPVKAYLVEAQKGVQRISSLVSSLLGFSRKSTSLDKDSMPLTRVLDEAVSAVRYRNEGKNILLHLDYSSENPVVNANDFYQIATNILSNAFDAVGPERGNVTVTTSIEKEKLYLVIRDDGCGIPKSLLPRLFEPFFTSKQLGRGTGLGLAIVKKLSEKYEGTITVDSQEMRGTTLHLAFPLHKVTY